jgi:predicted O-methyltransferase YrrM
MDIELISPQVEKYLDGLVPQRPDEVQAMENEAMEKKFPIIGPVCGHLCYLITRMIGARSVFELGSGYGYSTYWFARAVKENGGGVVHHVVWDEELSQKARDHLETLGLNDVVQYHISEAVEALKKSSQQYDLIFNDIDKEAYPDSLPVIKEKLRPGGMLIIDNMLWYGRIFDESDQTESTTGVREFTRLIASDPHWIISLAPIRDGMIIALKQ